MGLNSVGRLLAILLLLASSVGLGTPPGDRAGRLGARGIKRAQALRCARLLANANRDELRRYEAIRALGLQPEAPLSTFQAAQGIRVTQRNPHGHAAEGVLRVLSDNPHNTIYVISAENGWGARLTEADKLEPVPGTPYYEGKVRGLRHAMEYRLRVNGEDVLDPAADTFTSGEFLNSVFWDFDRPGAFHPTAPIVDLRGKFQMIAETGIPELVRFWEHGGRTGPARREETYRFIAESGVIEELARMGYNAVEFLPFNSAVDGEGWWLRYQVYGLFGPDSRYGTPDDFLRMIDAFNRAGIAVVMDAVIGHYPFQGNLGARSLAGVGLHRWKKGDGGTLYGSWGSPWGTYRYDYANPYVRRFLTDAVLTSFKRYRIGGIRVDNLDGIRFYDGPGGGGDVFLRELATEIRRFVPEALLIGEMFFGYDGVMAALDRGGMGFDLRTHSDLFDFFKHALQLRTEEIPMGWLRDAIRNPWWWNEATRVTYVTSHDEAANRRDGATGAYLATLLGGGGWEFVEKKTRAFAALAMLSGTAYMDLPQIRLLQEGTFTADPAIRWGHRALASQRRVYDFFSHLSRAVISRPAFALVNHHPNVENHTDYDNRIISLERIDFSTGKRIYAVINLSHRAFENYAVGVSAAGRYRAIVDSDAQGFVGATLDTHGRGSHGKPHSLTLPRLAPYGVLVLEAE